MPHYSRFLLIYAHQPRQTPDVLLPKVRNFDIRLGLKFGGNHLIEISIGLL